MKPRASFSKKILTRCLQLLAVGMVFLHTGCNQPKNIPDDKLVAIVGDLFLANAYWDTQNDFHFMQDSLDLYTPIFEQYGYKPKDFLFTIKNLSKRKSIKFSDVMQAALDTLQATGRPYANAIARIDSVNRIAGERYMQVVRFDSLPQHISNVKRATDKSTISLNIKPGRYEIEVVYELDTADRNPFVQYMQYVTDRNGTKINYLYRNYIKGNRNREKMILEVPDTITMWRTLEIYPAYTTLLENYDTKLTLDSLRICYYLPTSQILDSINQQILYSNPLDSLTRRNHERAPKNIIPFRLDSARVSAVADSLVRSKRKSR